MTDPKKSRKEGAEAEKKLYELGFLLSPMIPEDRVEGECTALKDIIAEEDGQIVLSDTPSMRELAYGIAHTTKGKKQVFEKAYFGSMVFELDPALVATVKKNVEAREQVVRSIFVERTKESLTPNPRPIRTFSGKDAEESGETYNKKTEEPAEPVDEQELDKTIDELVKG